MMTWKKGTLGIAFLLLIIAFFPVSGEEKNISPGSNVSLGDSGLDLSQAIGTCNAIAWWGPRSDTTNSSPSKVLLIANNVTNFSINAGDFVEHPGNWYQYDASNPNRAGSLVFIVHGYCGTEICPKPEIVSTRSGKDTTREINVSSVYYSGNDPIWYDDNISGFIEEWNEKMQWGLTTRQIEEISREMNATVLQKYRNSLYPGYLTIPNRTRFYLEVGEKIGLTHDQASSYAKVVVEDLDMRTMRNFESHPDHDASVKDGSSDETIPVLHTAVPLSQVSAGNTTITPSSDNPLKILTSLWNSIVNATGNIFWVS